MIRFMLIGALALLIGSDASAQTSAQWSQLLSYVSQQTKLIIDLRTRMERMEASDAQQRATLNATIAALDQERCRISRLTTAFKDYYGNSPPIVPTWVEGVACVDLKSPVPPFPVPIQAPQ